MEAVKRVENNPNSYFRYKATEKVKLRKVLAEKEPCSFEEAMETLARGQELIKLGGR